MSKNSKMGNRRKGRWKKQKQKFWKETHRQTKRAQRREN